MNDSPPGRLPVGWLQRLYRMQASPHRIARSYALGVFLATTPFIGLKIWIALLITTCCKGHRGAAAFGVYHINLFTAPFFYSLSFLLGSQLLGIEAELLWPTELSLRALYQAFTASRGVFLSLLLGGLCLGTPAAYLVYRVTLHSLQSSNYHPHEPTH